MLGDALALGLAEGAVDIGGQLLVRRAGPRGARHLYRCRFLHF